MGEDHYCDSCDDPRSNTDVDCPPASKRKCRGSAAYKTKYSRSWGERYSSVQAVKGDLFSFICCGCRRKVSCKHQGIDDVKCHIEGTSHKRVSKDLEQQPCLSFASMHDPTKKRVSVCVCVCVCV